MSYVPTGAFTYTGDVFVAPTFSSGVKSFSLFGRPPMNEKRQWITPMETDEEDFSHKVNTIACSDRDRNRCSEDTMDKDESDDGQKKEGGESPFETTTFTASKIAKRGSPISLADGSKYACLAVTVAGNSPIVIMILKDVAPKKEEEAEVSYPFLLIHDASTHTNLARISFKKDYERNHGGAYNSKSTHSLIQSLAANREYVLAIAQTHFHIIYLPTLQFVKTQVTINPLNSFLLAAISQQPDRMSISLDPTKRDAEEKDSFMGYRIVFPSNDIDNEITFKQKQANIAQGEDYGNCVSIITLPSFLFPGGTPANATSRNSDIDEAAMHSGEDDSVSPSVPLFGPQHLHNGIVTSQISTHSSALCAVALNHNGTRLVTASVQGRTLRLFCLRTKRVLAKCWRGIHACHILALHLFTSNHTVTSEQAELVTITCLGARGTLHIFRNVPLDHSGATAANTNYGYTFTDVNKIGIFLPRQTDLRFKKFQITVSPDGTRLWVAEYSGVESLAAVVADENNKMNKNNDSVTDTASNTSAKKSFLKLNPKQICSAKLSRYNFLTKNSNTIEETITVEYV